MRALALQAVLQTHLGFFSLRPEAHGLLQQRDNVSWGCSQQARTGMEEHSCTPQTPALGERQALTHLLLRPLDFAPAVPLLWHI